MEWQFNSDRPIYAQLVEQIELAIATGAYLPGARLPGVRELAAEAGVNPNTMQRALAQLETMGLLFTQRTNGRFVTEDTVLVSQLRQQLAQNITKEYLQKMLALGYTQLEIAGFVQASS